MAKKQRSDTIGKLEAWMHRREMSVAEVAAKVGVARQNIYMIIRGGRIPGLRLAVELEALTGIAAREWLA